MGAVCPVCAMAPPSNSSASLPDKLAEITLKAIAVGGFPAGAVGAGWQLIKDDGDLLKAVASAVIGLGLSYGANLLQPLHQGNQRRLTAAGERLDDQIEQGLTRLTGFDDWYLQCQAWDCQGYRPEGMAQYEGIFKLLLDEVFVPLELDFGSQLPGFNRQQQGDLAQAMAAEDLKIWPLLAQAETSRPLRQLAVLAWGGYGKTTLLKHIAHIYSTKRHKTFGVPKRLPVLLVLRKYRDLLASDAAPDLPTLITDHHIPNLPKEGHDRPVPANWATDMLRGKAIILLDGFDEVAKPQRPAVARWINTQMRNYGNAIFILTSRPKAYKEQDAADRLDLSTALWVRDFNADQRRDFVQRWYHCQERYENGGRATPDVAKQATEAAADLLSQIEARPELRDLAKNPLLLNLITTFHRRYPGANLPQRRVELYRDICQLQLRDRPRARRLDTLLTEGEPQIILQMVALKMMENRQERIAHADLLPLLTTCLAQQDEPLAAAEFLEQVVQISELLVQQEDEYEFAHLSFQEYLAAAEIARTQTEATLYPHIADDWWKPTLLLYAAQLKKPAPFIRKLLDTGATDLAYACWQDTTKRIDPDLVKALEGLGKAVADSRYHQLDQYLQNQQWEAADDETYRLMITTVGKEEGQLFTADELLNFPCDVLKAIDDLWVRHSNGRFGFSVQKNLYLSKEVGGVANGKYNKKSWDKFCQINGWKQLGSRSGYLETKYTFESPEAHLPCVLRGWRRLDVDFDGGDGIYVQSLASSQVHVKSLAWWGSIFSRIQTCKL